MRLLTSLLNSLILDKWKLNISYFHQLFLFNPKERLMIYK